MYPPATWIRVIELTRAMQPHMHVILSFGPGCSPRARCEQRARYDEKWLRKECECLEHTFSKSWYRITGDSYVVDVREVVGSDSSYLSKYVAKSYLHSDAFEALGFTRRWSRSRTWRVERLRLKTTAAGEWSKVQFTYGQGVVHGLLRYGEWKEWVRWGEVSHLRARVGTELARELQNEVEDQAAKRKLLDMIEVLRACNKEHNGSNGNRGRE